MVRQQDFSIKLKLKECFNKRHIMLALIYVLSLAVGACLAVYLMWGVYHIDVHKIRENARVSVSEVDVSKRVYDLSLYGLTTDWFTDPLMLNNASFLGRNPFFDAILNPRAEKVTAEDQWRNFQLAVNASSLRGFHIVPYPRFWHGYLLFLKPLLVFFDLEGIRCIHLIVQLSLLAAVLFLMYKRLGFRCCTAFIASMCFLNPVTSWMCLEYASVINVMLLATLWVLLNKNPNDNQMFFVIGAVTIFFDFLTFPLITLGVPLIVYICLYKRGFKEDVKCVIKNCFLWLFGYAGMLFSKWVLATMLTNENVIKDGFENVLRRMYGITEEGWDTSVTLGRSILLNVNVILNTNTLVILGISFVLIFSSYMYSSYRIRGNLRALVLFGVGLMPFVWYSLLVQHSIIHPHWTYKILSISIYALLSAVVCCLEPKKEN